MPSDFGEKTEAPTPRRLQEAREKGQVARSPDLTAAMGLLAGLVLLNVLGSDIIKGLMRFMQQSLMLNDIPVQAAFLSGENVKQVLQYAWLAVGPFMMVLFVVALIANLMQVGFVFAAKPVIPSLDRISPLSGLKRLFSTRSAMRLAMSLSKVGIIAVVAFLTIKSFWPQLIQVASLPCARLVQFSGHLIFILGLRMALVLAILALIDFGFQKYKWVQDLRMSKEELKEEMKRMEGDPLMRQRRRNVARQLAAQRMSQAVPKADVVITNPTHLAIALKYEPEKMLAPKVVARGAGYIAQRIREIALEHSVPVIERKPIAQALYKSCQVGDYVPPELYKAVAEVLAYVFELAGKGYRNVRAG